MPVEMNLTTDHQQIRRWAESAGGRPVQEPVAGTSLAVPSIEFAPEPADGARTCSWEDWFAAFDQAGLALLYQESEPDGSPSRFAKLVQRDTA